MDDLLIGVVLLGTWEGWKFLHDKDFSSWSRVTAVQRWSFRWWMKF
jgi:hypothetical protein